MYPEKYFVYSEMTMMVVRRTSEVSENAREKVIPILIRSNLKSTGCADTIFQMSGALWAGSIGGMNELVQVDAL